MSERSEFVVLRDKVLAMRSSAAIVRRESTRRGSEWHRADAMCVAYTNVLVALHTPSEADGVEAALGVSGAKPTRSKPPGDMVAEVERIARITGNRLLIRASEWLRAERAPSEPKP